MIIILLFILQIFHYIVKKKKKELLSIIHIKLEITIMICAIFENVKNLSDSSLEEVPNPESCLCIAVSHLVSPDSISI